MKLNKIIAAALAVMLVGSTASVAVSAADTESSNPYEVQAAKYDEQAYSGNDLGAVCNGEDSTTFKLWSPSASNVKLNIFTKGSDDEVGAGSVATYTMKKEDNGIWTINLSGIWSDYYYTYSVTDAKTGKTVETADPYAKAAGVEIIVAVNKIDKPSANIEKVKQELTEYELIPEDWGGSTIFVPVSAHTKEGIDDLLEMILLTAEVQELKANPNRKARGIVIEAELDKGRGPVATVLVQKGTLKVGDHVAAGACHGKIRAMVDDKGHRVREAGPSIPVEILGLNDVPNAGEILVAMDSDKEARNFAETFISEGRKKLLDDTKHKVSLDALFEQIQAGNVKELGIIIKADVQGSVEAVKQSLVKLSNEEVVVKIIHGGVGNINESDVVLASASNAIIIGFNVKPDNQARIVAEREKVDLRLYSVIYNAIEDVESALKGMLEPIYEEQVIGHVEIRQIFKASGVGNIAGSFVTDGKITRNASVRITREGEKTYEGPIASLKRFKDEVKEVKAGYECGLVFEKFNDIQEGDIIEAYEMVEVPR